MSRTLGVIQALSFFHTSTVTELVTFLMPQLGAEREDIMGMNISNSNKAFKDAIANYKLGAFELADELKKLRRDLGGWESAIQSNLDLIAKTTSEAKQADLLAEIDLFNSKIADRRKAYEATTAEIEKRTAPFYKFTERLYVDYTSMRATADIATYKKAVKAFLDGQGVKYDDKAVTMLVVAVGARGKSANALYKDSSTMTEAETKKKFRDIIARVMVDLCGDQLPVYKWSYKPVKIK
jgi:hypothetical protein